jgi:hypothetical protein
MPVGQGGTVVPPSATKVAGPPVGHGGTVVPPSATMAWLLEEWLTAKETGSSISPAKATIRSELTIRFILENLLGAHFPAWRREAMRIGEFVHETEQRQEWHPWNRLIGIGV